MYLALIILMSGDPLNPDYKSVPMMIETTSWESCRDLLHDAGTKAIKASPVYNGFLYECHHVESLDIITDDGLTGSF